MNVDAKTLAATNLFDGIDWYSTEELPQRPRLLRTTMHTMAANANVVLPITFIHDGQDVLSGGTVGGARITNVASGQTVQLLQHGTGTSKILCYTLNSLIYLHYRRRDSASDRMFSHHGSSQYRES